ncbi:glutathione S-transferase N-terminal domain-containing protein [Bradyrhizobium cajani]|uniref:Glutathione S-transferase n=1 Tax=Bradyrhizobium cajani TaxID=1928661 RepID=A0A844TFR8_9BRAD|nr:glutathione S-transferase N-terminal domain-containing protein [Bradyrhizobium cajani]MCP3371774.1 glutathione S-transferase N-terminal domain-containing protein [Bradyrhizobium cajani]MVT76405.1 glutathione S-transferase [Bradyrhizobium cajani]
MMILHSNATSPYVRKVRIAIQLLGLSNRIEEREVRFRDPTDPFHQNPLSKVPVFVGENGSLIYDSPVILEYLDHLAGGGCIIPRDPDARFAALTLHALCDGALDACVLVMSETWFRPPDLRVESWVDRQSGKIERALTVLEAAPPTLSDVPDVGQIALACLLGYRDFRFDGTWRKAHPRLHAWHDAFAAKVPAFAATTPVDP